MSDLVAPFPYFGVKSRAAELVWSLLGDVENYVEPFAGSLAVLLQRPNPTGPETVNDYDAMICNVWRALSYDPDAVAYHADWPCNETDLHARHMWLVHNLERIKAGLDDPEWYDAKAAGWWIWGTCNWIGHGFTDGTGPWVLHEGRIVDRRKLPHLGDAGKGINRQLPHLSRGQGINRKLPHLSAGQGRYDFILGWFSALHARLRDVRVTCGDWSRVLTDSVTTHHGLTAVFLDPPYEHGEMDYGAGGMGLQIAERVRDWCRANGGNRKLRIVLCGHAGEHDSLLADGWTAHKWTARKGYANTDDAKARAASETVWASPHCVGAASTQGNLL